MGLFFRRVFERFSSRWDSCLKLVDWFPSSQGKGVVGRGVLDLCEVSSHQEGMLISLSPSIFASESLRMLSSGMFSSGMFPLFVSNSTPVLDLVE